MRFWRPKGTGGGTGGGTDDDERRLAEARPSAAGGAPLGLPEPFPHAESSPAIPAATSPPAATAPPGIMRPVFGMSAGPIASLTAPGAPFGNTRLSRGVRQLVSTLGSTRGDVAAVLEAAGVRAAPRDAERTPVSVYLATVIGADPHVKSVKVDDRSVVVQMHAWWRSDVVVDLPPVVQQFTAAFDESCYPALLPPGPRAG